MDEAEYLGDVIGILSAGKLLVEGSGIKLKNEFGEGYELTIIKVTLEFDNQIIFKHVREVIPNAHLEYGSGLELLIILPLGDIQNFHLLF